MQDDPNLRLKRLVIRIGVGFVCLLVFIASMQWLYHYLTTGTIIVTTDNKNVTVTVSSALKSASDGGFSKSAIGSMTVNVRSGKYTVSVQNGFNGTNRSVTVSGRSTKSVTIRLIQPTGVEPVVYTNSQNIAADNSSLTYLNPTVGVSRIDTNNTINVLPNTEALVSTSWATPNFGVGFDPNSGLKLINNNSVTPLRSPVKGNVSGADIAYAIAPNKTIYIADGSAVYRGTADGVFTKIYNNRPADSSLAAGNDKVALISSGFGSTHPEVIIVSSSGEAISKTPSATITGWSSWSPDGKYIVIISGTTSEILDSTFRQVATVPQGGITSMDWLKNDTLLYGSGSQLWSYAIAQQQSQVIANMPLNYQIINVAVSSDNSYVYVATGQNGGVQPDAIRRIGFKGQNVLPALYSLQSLLPLEGTNYSVSLINFSGTPNVIVYVPSDDTAAASLQAAQQDMQGLVDTTDMKFVTELAPEG